MGPSSVMIGSCLIFVFTILRLFERSFLMESPYKGLTFGS